MKYLIKSLLRRKTLLTQTVSARCVHSIKMYLADGYSLVFKGAVAILTKWVVL